MRSTVWAEIWMWMNVFWNNVNFGQMHQKHFVDMKCLTKVMLLIAVLKGVYRMFFDKLKLNISFVKGVWQVLNLVVILSLISFKHASVSAPEKASTTGSDKHSHNKVCRFFHAKEMNRFWINNWSLMKTWFWTTIENDAHVAIYIYKD